MLKEISEIAWAIVFPVTVIALLAFITISCINNYQQKFIDAGYYRVLVPGKGEPVWINYPEDSNGIAELRFDFREVD